ncbi:hypothetical protein [Amycolatopsis tolypomycina]|nr:hypothetical protein [Amycolatopsis tolypomycina]
MDAALARIDAVLAEPDPQLLADARWLIAANPSLGQAPAERVVLAWDGSRGTDAIVAAALAHHAYRGLTLPPAATPAARKYVAPPVDTRPGFLGRLRRRLFGEPPQ